MKTTYNQKLHEYFSLRPHISECSTITSVVLQISSHISLKKKKKPIQEPKLNNNNEGKGRLDVL